MYRDELQMNILQINITTNSTKSILDITNTLNKFHVFVLDISHIEVHGSYSLVLLVKLPEDNTEDFIKEMLYLGYTKDLLVQVRPMAHEEYQEWISNKGEKNYILTLLGWDITGEHIKEVCYLIYKNDLRISFIDRLSEIKPLNNDSKNISCIEFYLNGRMINVQNVHSDILDFSQKLGVDIGFQEDNIYRRHRRLIAFDMDSTLIQTEIIDELAKEAGVFEKVYSITKMAMEGRFDFKESLRKRVALLKGLNISVLDKIAEELPLTEGASKLIRTLKLLGYKVAIISGGFMFFGKRLKESLDIDYVYANDLEIIDGKLTGKVKGDIIDGEKKAEILNELTIKENISLEQVIAVGDGANDLPMLKIAGLGIAFRAKPLVKKGAKQSISNVGLDGILYFLGLKESELINLST